MKRYRPVEWDGIARYHDGTPIDVVKAECLDMEMATYDRLPKHVRDELKTYGGIAMEYEPQAMSGREWM